MRETSPDDADDHLRAPWLAAALARCDLVVLENGKAPLDESATRHGSKILKVR